ncbi:MAG: hypothetical protein HN368_14705 [Spirochaetales bacterium]|nr:hypothetical protein [Spirochaetales bacterium]
MSEDEIGAVNSDMFSEFFLPELAELSNHFGGIGIHCCADARHQWQNIKLIPNLKLLNLVQDKDIVDDAYPFFGSSLVHYHQPQINRRGIPWKPTQKIPSTCSVLEAHADDRDEAIRLAEILAERTGK